LFRFLLAAAACLAAAAALVRPSPAPMRYRLLPRGTVELSSEMVVPPGTELRGASSGTILRAAPGFRGRALIVCTGAGIRLRDFVIDGNRAALEVRAGLPPSDRPFARFTANNGILAEGVERFSVSNVTFREIAGFAVLVSRSRHVLLSRLHVAASGSRNPAGRNNTTGGILLEEGTARFRVSDCEFRDIRGNAVWTHSLYTSPRNRAGDIVRNRFYNIGRDAIQVGHAGEVWVSGNQGSHIGFPSADVDREGGGVPVGIDTAGNVANSAYIGNRFDTIDGKCIDLDGFHDGYVSRNVCVSVGSLGIVMNNTNPDMQSRNITVEDNELRDILFGGIFVIGSGHTIRSNRLLDLNRAHCNENAARAGCYYPPGEPDRLRSGIYLGRGAERPDPALHNLVERNEITGFKMAERCVATAPGIAPEANTIRDNICRDR